MSIDESGYTKREKEIHLAAYEKGARDAFLKQATQQPVELSATPQDVIDYIDEALQGFDGCEVNPSNYRDEDVCHLNEGYVGLFQTLEHARSMLNNLATPSLRLMTVQSAAEVIAAADLDDCGGGDWKNYRHMAEALIGRFHASPPEREVVTPEELQGAIWDAMKPAGMHESDVAKRLLKSFDIRRRGSVQEGECN
jgi:hypothetical protein